PDPSVWLGPHFDERGCTTGNTHQGHMAIDSAICCHAIACIDIDHAISPVGALAS
ncbi:hypothetical protein LCGC14_2611630, partial [marine sediment metagenome]